MPQQGDGIVLTNADVHSSETTTGGITTFEWPVQVYNFDLSESNVFLLWLHSGTSSEQGLDDGLSVTSHYFNITGDASTSATTDSGSTITSSASGSSSSTTGSSTSGATDTVTSGGTTDRLSTAVSTLQNTAVSTGSSGTAATATTSPTDTTKPGPHGGVPTGTIVGIVIGVCLFGLPGLLGCLLYFWRHRKKQRTGETDPDEFLKASKDDTSKPTSTKTHPNTAELEDSVIKGELMAEPFFRGQVQELHERYVKPELELLAEPFFRDRVQEVHGHSCGPELHSDPCGPELPAEAVLRTRLRDSHSRSRRAHRPSKPGTEPWAENWAELGFRAELP